MFCYYCGKENKDGAAFCTHCGRQLRQAAVTAQAKTSTPEKPPKRKTKAARQSVASILLGVLLFIVLAGGVICALVYFEVVDIPVIADLLGSGEEESSGEPADNDDAVEVVEPEPSAEETTAPTEDPDEVLYQEVLAACEALASQGDYDGAVDYLITCEMDLNDPRVSELLDRYIQMSINEVLNTAAAYADMGNYKEAAQHLLNNIEECDCEALQEQLASYREHLTIPLSSCPVLEDSNPAGKTSDISIGIWDDIYGIKHPDSVRFWVVSKTGYNNTEYVVYNLDQQYTTLSGQIVSDSDSDANSHSVIMIYLDDELVYTSSEITMSSASVSFSIYVGEAEELRIVCTTDSSNFHYCIVDAELCEV